jgi:hypothetical protein
MATIAVSPKGTAFTPSSAAGGGDVLPCADNYVLTVYNTDSSSHSFTLVTSATYGGRAVADDTFALTAGQAVSVPLTYQTYADGNGQTSISYTAATGMKLWVTS